MYVKFALAGGKQNLAQPGKAYETVLRDGMATDNFRPAGIYFGTRTGKLYGSANEGASWQLIVEGLPPVTCVKAAMVDGGSGAGKLRAAKVAGKAKGKKAGKKRR